MENEERLTEVVNTLEAIRTEIMSWDHRDYEWLIIRLREATSECKFMIHMRFKSKPGKAGLKTSISHQTPHK